MRNKIIRIMGNRGSSISSTELARLCKTDEMKVEGILTDLEADGLIECNHWFYHLTFDGFKEYKRIKK